MAANADIQNGDVLVTSGIDGTYPPGLPVAQVARIERDAAYAVRAHHLPARSPASSAARYVLVLETAPRARPPPEEAGAERDKRAGKSRKPRRKDG